MIQKQIWKKTAVLTTTLSLMFTSCLTGCGNSESKQKTDKNGTETSDSRNTAMGRYLEEEIQLPEECADIADMIVLDDGMLRVAFYKSGGGIVYADSSDGGKTWKEPVELAKVLGLDTEKYRLSYPKLGAKGEIFVSCYAVSQEAEGAEQNSFYYFAPDGTCNLVSIADELSSGYITEAHFTGHDTIIVNDFSSALLEINLCDSSVVRKYEEGNSVISFNVVKDHLVALTESAVHFYDTKTGEPLEDGAALNEQLTSNKNNLEMTSTSSYPVLFTDGGEDSIYCAEDGGIYRYALGGSVLEQVIDGSLNRISSPDTAFVALDRDEEGHFYLAVQDFSAGIGDTAKLLKYTYSADTPATPDTELTVYSLTDNSFIRQAATLFQRKYPDIYLNFEIGLAEENGMTSTDALKNLNTEIMAGNGPDVLLLDGIPEDIYIEKDMLMDISEILDKVDEADGILDNIRKPYQEEDGSQYVMPVKFNIPMLQGKKEDLEQVQDLVSAADMLEKYQDEYEGMHLPISLMGAGAEGFLRIFADVNVPSWQKEDGTLDEQAITEYLEQAGRIYQLGKTAMNQLKEMGAREYSLNEMKEFSGIDTSSMLTLSGYIKLAAGRLKSPESLAYLYSVEQTVEGIGHKKWNGQSKDCFIPVQTIGISAKADEKDAAEKLVEFLFSREGQSSGKAEGFPVNEAVYDSEEYWAAGDVNGSLGTTGSSNMETGEFVEMDIVRADAAVTKEIQELGRTLTIPSKGNEIILEAVTKNGSRYLNGESTLEEAAKAVIQQVKLYLSE